VNLACRRQAAAVWLAAGLACILLGGCATVPPAGAAAAPPPTTDPWENWNRKVFAFNEAVDEALLKPVATAYQDYVPQLVRTGIDNVFGNIYDAWSAANQLLQGKLESGLEMGVRVLTNTFVGLGGLLDPASEMGMTRRSEDFGQTLGRWGVPNGPFVVLPLLGPSTLRDTVGLVVDRQISPAQLTDSSAARWGIASLELINIRANLLQTSRFLDDVALDKYSFIRDAYLSYRLDAVYDGAPPMEKFEDEWQDEPPTTPTQQSPG
jgi:phospholipid-binding lipoprotein MlaA